MAPHKMHLLCNNYLNHISMDRAVNPKIQINVLNICQKSSYRNLKFPLTMRYSSNSLPADHKNRPTTSTARYMASILPSGKSYIGAIEVFIEPFSFVVPIEICLLFTFIFFCSTFFLATNVQYVLIYGIPPLIVDYGVTWILYPQQTTNMPNKLLTSK